MNPNSIGDSVGIIICLKIPKHELYFGYISGLGMWSYPELEPDYRTGTTYGKTRYWAGKDIGNKSKFQAI